MKDRIIPPGWIHLLGFVALMTVLAPSTAFAYIDPGTGSLAWQIILSAVLGSMFYARRGMTAVRQSISRWLRRAPQVERSREAEAADSRE